MKKIVFIILLFTSYAASAADTLCEKYLSPATLDEVLEVAGTLEASLKSTIAQATDTALQNDAAERLVALEILIDQLLEPVNTNDQTFAAEMSARIEELSHAHLSDTRLSKAAVKIHNVEIRKQAVKDFEALQPQLQAKFKMFTEEISSSSTVSPKWDLEKIRMNEITKEDCYSVRLNQGYRVLFVFDAAHNVVIYRISKSVTHNN